MWLAPVLSIPKLLPVLEWVVTDHAPRQPVLELQVPTWTVSDHQGLQLCSETIAGGKLQVPAWAVITTRLRNVFKAMQLKDY